MQLNGGIRKDRTGKRIDLSVEYSTYSAAEFPHGPGNDCKVDILPIGTRLQSELVESDLHGHYSMGQKPRNMSRKTFFHNPHQGASR
jgi:hypothetical protein